MPARLLPRLCIVGLAAAASGCSASFFGAEMTSSGTGPAAGVGAVGTAPPAGPAAPDPLLPHDGNGHFVAAAEAYLHLYAAASGLALAADQNSAGNSGASPMVVMLDNSNSRLGLWSRRPLDGDSFQLLHTASGQCLTATPPALGLAACGAAAGQAFGLQAVVAGAAPGAGGGEPVQLVAANDACVQAGGAAAAAASLGACAGAGWRVLPWQPGAAAGRGWTGIIGTGQSLSIGFAGTPVVSPVAARGLSIKLFDPAGAYPTDDAQAPAWVVAPLFEPIRPYPADGVDDSYPNNIHGETPHTAMAAQLDALAEAAGLGGWVTAHSVVGRGAQPMSVIKKGGTGNNYAAAITETRAFAAIAGEAARPYAVGAVVLTHGEADVFNPNYALEVTQLARDLQADVGAITGQDKPPILLASQQNSFPSNTAVPLSSLGIVQAANDSPGDIFVTGPKYQYPYLEGIHLLAGGYRRLGHKTAEVYWRISQRQEAWRPLQPLAVELTAPTQLSVSFHVPDPPLVLDDGQPARHQAYNTAWARGRGFEVSDAAGAPVAIAGVSVAASGARVVIELAAPAARPLTLAYGITQDGDDGGGGGYHGGTGLGRGGDLRDSDPFVAIDREQITCAVEAGQAALTCPAGLAGRTPGDLVEEAQAAIVDIAGGTVATLSRPWSGATGTRPLTFRASHYNFLVSFVWPLP